jgi:hypothetical protein
MCIIIGTFGSFANAEFCQRGISNCGDSGSEPGCCGPQGNHRCCNYDTNSCVDC